MTKKAAAPAAPPPLDMNAALNQYGILAQIVNAIPDLRAVLQASAQAGDSTDAFTAKIAATPWYQQHSDTLRNLIFQNASDPATYNNNQAQARALVMRVAGQMGRQVDVGNMAFRYLAEGWDAATLQQNIAWTSPFAPQEGVGTGDAGKYQQALKQTAADYGVPVTDQFIADYINKIQSGADTQDGFDNLMKARAKAAYPQFAAQIDQGLSMKDVADPYAAQMAKTLELPQTAVKWQTDPLIQRALTAKDPTTGQPTGQPLWQFNQALMKDPRYDHTMQAKTDAYSVVSEIGKSWGFYA